MVKESPKVTVSIVLHNSGEYLSQTLASMHPLALDNAVRVIAIDNASPDDSREIVRRDYPWVTLVDAKQNLGYANGHNLIFPLIDTDYWLLLNPDAYFTSPTGLSDLIAWMDSHPDIAAVSPSFAEIGGGISFGGRRFPSIFLHLFEFSRLHKLLPRSVRGNILLGSYWTDGCREIVDWVPGTALLLRRSAVSDFGLMAKGFFMYGEDIELCHRICHSGWKVACVGSITIHHANSTSSVRSFGEFGKEVRMCRGIFDAVEVMRGKLYARTLFFLYRMTNYVESADPRKSTHEREKLLRQNEVIRTALNNKKKKKANDAI